MGRHPVDRHGRAIPDGSWPVGKEAPARLERVRRLVNTVNRESGGDHLGDAESALAWLRGDGWPVTSLDEAGLGRLTATRELVRRLAVAHRDGGADAGAWGELLAIGGSGVRPVAANGRIHLAGTGHGPGGVEHVVSEVVAIVVECQLDGTLDRLKACRNDQCRWVVYDRSRSATATWCSMSACGQRHKQRAYRLRQAGSGASR